MRKMGERLYGVYVGNECVFVLLFAKQFAVGTEADELQHLVIGLAVDQQQAHVLKVCAFPLPDQHKRHPS